MELIFLKPFYLYFLLLIPTHIVFHFLSIRYSKRKAMLFANFDVLKRLSRKYTLNYHTTLLILRIFIIIFIILIMADTKLSFQGYGDTTNYMLAVDTSVSMLSKDYTTSRLDTVKTYLDYFVDNANYESSIGILTFSSVTKIISPVSQDKLFLKDKIQKIEISPNMGTNLGDTIHTGVNFLIASEGAKKIILLTDGQNNWGDNLEEGLKYAREYGVSVTTIGIGTNESQISGTNLTFELNENELKNIAEFTGGEYFQIKSQRDFKTVFDEIKKEKQQQILIDVKVALSSLILFFLVCEFIFVKTIYKITP